MGYPPQPQDPYGQQPPSQPYGHSGPQPQYGYGYQQPTAPPPPPRRSNLPLILTLAIGLPLLLLGGCAAIVVVLSDSGRDAVVTEADPPNMVVPTKEPAASAPPAESSAPAAEEAKKEPATAAIGAAITLQGMDPGLQVKVTVARLVDPATPASDFMKPKAGNRFVAVEVTLENVGEAVYSDAPMNGALLIDGEGQQYRSTVFDVQEGQSFGGMATINKGDSRKGVVVFEVPEGAKLAKFQFGLNSGFAEQKGEWTLN